MEQEIPKTSVFHGMVSIVGRSGFFAGKALDIHAGEVITIGRDRNVCTMLFPPDYEHVSNIHCELRSGHAGKSVSLMDKDSKNGTYVEDGRRLAPGEIFELKDGDAFYIADQGNTFRIRII